MDHPLKGLAGRARKAKWRERSDQVEWDVPDGRLGGVIIQLRDRGQQSYTRAQWILYALLAVIFVGLGYYVVRPVVQDLSDGKRAIYREQIGEGNAENQKLDQERTELKRRLVADLAPAGVSVKTGVEGNVVQLLHIPGTQVLLASIDRFTRGLNGLILRSKDGGKTWDEVASDLERRIWSLVHVSGSKLVVGAGPEGTIMRSENNGQSWEQVFAVDQHSIFEMLHLPNTQDLIAVGDMNGVILRSEDSGATWTRVRSGTKSTLFELLHIPGTGTLISTGNDGAITRSDDNGETWEAVDSGTNSSIRRLVHIPETDILVIADEDGNIKRSTDSGRTWKSVENERKVGSYEPWKLVYIPDIKTLFLTGARGTVLSSTNNGAIWKPANLGLEGDIYDLTYLAKEKVLIVTGDGVGRNISRSQDNGKTWQRISVGVEDRLVRIVPVSKPDSVFAFGLGGNILVSNDFGRTWIPVASGTGTTAAYQGKVLNSGEIILPRDDGSIVRITDELSDKLQETNLSLGPEGDQALLKGFADLPEEIRNHSKLASYSGQFEALIRNRERATEKLATAHKALEDLGSGAYSVAQKQDAFADFMDSCRMGEDPDGKVTQACTAAFKDIIPNETKSWWTTVAEEVPRGILLLFLLATLGTLYRYNLRLAAFHHSRADALELMSKDVDLAPEALVKLTDAMSAEKVEFGKANTPADQAADVAKTVLNKVK